jgi:hypothetical protein
MVKFSMPLPNDELYCPVLQCSSYDNIFMGFNQPLIGTFTIPIGQLMQDLRKERKEETEAIAHIIEELDKIIRGEGMLSYSIQGKSETGSDNEGRAIEEV